MDHDAAFKLMFSLPGMAESLIRMVASPELASALDFSTLERRPSELVDADLAKRLGDMLWRVTFHDGPQLQDGSRPYLVVMIEFQSTPEPRMAERIHEYTDKLMAELARNGTVAREGARPPVLPIVVYNGDRPWYGAGDLADLVAPVPAARELAPFQLSQRYHRVDAGAGASADLPLDNWAAAPIRLQNSPTPADLMSRLREEFARFPGAGEERELRAALYAWAGEIWRRLTGDEQKLPPLEAFEASQGEKENMPSFMETRIRQWRAEIAQQIAEGRARGIAEGRAQGHAQGIVQGHAQGIELSRNEERGWLCRWAALKFGAETGERLAASLEQLRDPETLARVGDWIIECDTSAELFDRVRGRRWQGGGTTGESRT